MSIPYGYTINTQQNGVVNPPASLSNESWQRKRFGSSLWESISGSSGATYTIVKDDKNCKIRKVETLSDGSVLYSNELQVENFTDPVEWVYTSEVLGFNLSTCIGGSERYGTLFAAVRDDGDYRLTEDGGKTWLRFKHGVDVPIGMWAEGPDSKDLLIGGYGGGRTDDNVQVLRGNGGSWFSGFPSGTYVYGIAKTPDGNYITVDIGGNVWVATTKGGSFTNVKSIHSHSVTLLGQLHGSQEPWGVALASLWKFKQATTSDVIYEKIEMPFAGNGNSYVHDLAYDRGSSTWVAVGDRNHIFWSNDGQRSWQKITGPFSYDCAITGVCFAGNTFWATGAYLGKIYLASSPDGKNWTMNNLPSGLNQSGWTSPRMVGHGQYGLWTFNTSSSPYKSYLAVLEG